MKFPKMWMAAPAIFLLLTSAGAQNKNKAVQSRVAFAHGLPVLNGGRLHVSLVEVTYGPGGFSLPHTHPCPVIGYVVEGDLRVQVNHEAETVYHTGQTFYEASNSAHLVSANASSQKPVKFVAYFVCDHEAPLSVAMPKTQEPGEK